MPAPVISGYSNSVANDRPAGTVETTGSLSWGVGDIVVVLGSTEDNAKTLGTPTTTGSGLVFSALTGSPSNIASSCKVYGWSATATQASSGTISSAIAGATAGVIGAWVLSSHNGLGNVVVSSATATSDPFTISLTRAGTNSAVLLMAADWSANTDTSTDPSPLAGSTQRIGDDAGFVSGIATMYASDWSNEGAPGTTSYGVANVTNAGSGFIFTLIAVEVKGTGSTVTPLNVVLGEPTIGSASF